MHSEREITYGELFGVVAGHLTSGLSKGEVFMSLVSQGYDVTASAEFVEYVAKATGGHTGARRRTTRIMVR